MTQTAPPITSARNYVAGQWADPASDKVLDVTNPADGQTIGRVGLSSAQDIDAAAAAARDAYQQWRAVPAMQRVQPLFQLKALLEENAEDLARTITLECGKTLGESRGELKRAIENVEVAAGIPMMMQGEFTQDIARGIDEFMVRQPLGVCAAICPFNFPAMIPFWFLPYAVACGNAFIIKPAERVPLTMQKVFELIDQLDIPAGLVSLVNGDRVAADAMLEHPTIKAISFVGSTEVARAVYAKAAANGKRAQCQGGAKNPILVLPDCDLEMTTRIAADSAFGCSGQRCLAASLAVTVGEAKSTFTDAITQAADQRRVGSGLDEQTQMGPVITPASRDRIRSAVDDAQGRGARPLVDGRDKKVNGGEAGNFVGPTILDGLPADDPITGTEVFGPVLGLMHMDTIDQAIDWINRSRYGNMACVFTSSGTAARRFRAEVDAGNIGVAAPMATFPFSGWKDSFFGDLHGQGRHAVEFFTQTKVVVERWPKTWSRQF